MKTLLSFLLFCLFEFIAVFLFKLLAQLAFKRSGFDIRSILKGVVERVFLTIALLLDYPHALTFFSALKLGTRLKYDDKDNKAFNDFYLIGNLLSVSIVFLYVFLIKKYYL